MKQNRVVLTKEELKAKIARNKRFSNISNLKIGCFHAFFIIFGLGSIVYGNVIGGSAFLLLWLAFLLST